MSTATLIPLLAAPRPVDVKGIDRDLAEPGRPPAAESEADLLRTGPHPGRARGGGADPQPGQAGDPAGYAGGPLLAGAAAGGEALPRPPGNRRPRHPRHRRRP